VANHTFTKNIVVHHGQGITKVAYLTFQKGGHIYFGFTDKSRCAQNAKISFHPPNRIHVKNGDGEYQAEAFTFFNLPPGIESSEWKWFTAVSNPLFVIESGALRPERKDDVTLELRCAHNQSSIQIEAFKLPSAPMFATQIVNNAIHDYLSWGETHLRFEISLIDPRGSYLQPYVMN